MRRGGWAKTENCYDALDGISRPLLVKTFTLESVSGSGSEPMFLTRPRAPALARNALLGGRGGMTILQSGFQTWSCEKLFECHGAIHFSEIDVDMPTVCPPAVEWTRLKADMKFLFF